MTREYPKTVVLRKSIIGVVGISAFLMMMLIIYNLNASSNINRDKNLKNSTHIVASSSDVNWYETPTKTETTSNQNKLVDTNKKIDATTKNSEIKQKAVSVKDLSAQELQKAMSVPISSNQLLAEHESLQEMNQSKGTLDSSGMTVVDKDQNRQHEKSSFLKVNNEISEEYLLSTVKKPISPYELHSGSIIPGTLITGINSDLPGQITGQVTSNVFDSITGNYLLIPQGSKLIGLYDSQVAYGQERTLVVWKKIKFPNGDSLDLQGMPGADLAGYAGFNDLVNNHYSKLYGSVLLMSILSAGSQLSQPQTPSSPFGTPSVGQTIAQSLGTNIANTSNTLTNKNINIQPTLEIRPAYKFNIEVTKDIVFPGPYQNE